MGPENQHLTPAGIPAEVVGLLDESVVSAQSVVRPTFKLMKVSDCDDYPLNLRRLAHKGLANLECDLVRYAWDDDNKHNTVLAVRVDGEIAGLVPADFVPALKSHLDAGHRITVEVESVDTDPRWPTWRGLTIRWEAEVPSDPTASQARSSAPSPPEERQPPQRPAPPPPSVGQSVEAESILEGLTDEQRRAVTAPDSPLCVIAGAGSGKTRVLTRRIAWQIASGRATPSEVLAVTFTRRAGSELRSRLRDLGLAEGVAAGTFHATALSMLRRYWAETGTRPPTPIRQPTSVLQTLQLPPGIEPRWDRRTLNDYAREISWAAARMVEPDDYVEAVERAGRRLRDLRPSNVAAVYKAYERSKRRDHLIDFDDMLAMSRRVMLDYPRFAATQHKRHRHLLIDEFQDVNPLQFAILQSWLGPESTLTVVGDPKQAIFGWNGAEPDLLLRIGVHLPGVTVVELTTNFRSSPEILDAAAKILGVRPQPTTQPSGMRPNVRAIPDDEQEAATIVRAVQRSRTRGAPWHHQAILARTNKQLGPIRRALQEAQIPIRSRDAKGLLDYDEIEAYLLDFGNDERLQDLYDDLSDRHTATSKPWGWLSTFIRDLLALDSEATVEDLRDSVRSGDVSGPLRDGVDVITLHGSKGLEWPIVHVIGVEDGFVPLYTSQDSNPAREEEQRLLYVAATRAEQRLHFYWCRRRMRGDRLRDRSPSPWIKHLHPDG